MESVRRDVRCEIIKSKIEQCQITCCRYVTFVFISLLVLCGGTLIALSIVHQVQKDDFVVFFNFKYATAPTVLILVGSIIFIMASFGCPDAVLNTNKQNININYRIPCELMAFGAVRIIITVIEFVGAISVLCDHFEMTNMLKNNMNSTLWLVTETEFGSSPIPYLPEIDDVNVWNDMQTKLECCGVDSFEDYHGPLPVSCCPEGVHNCTQHDVYQIGCFDMILLKVNHRLYLFVAVGLAMGIFHMSLFPLLLCCRTVAYQAKKRNIESLFIKKHDSYPRASIQLENKV